MKSDQAFIDWNDKINTLTEAGQMEEAIDVGHQALTGAEQMSSPDQPAYLLVCLRLRGRLYRTQKRYSEAEPLLERALAVAENYYSSNDIRRVDSLMQLGLLYYEQNQFAQAESYYYRAVVILEEELQKNRNKEALLVPLEAATKQLIKTYQATHRDTEAACLSMRLAALKRWYKRWLPFLIIVLIFSTAALIIVLLIILLPYGLHNNFLWFLLIVCAPMGLMTFLIAIIAKRTPVPRLAPAPQTVAHPVSDEKPDNGV